MRKDVLHACKAAPTEIQYQLLSQAVEVLGYGVESVPVFFAKIFRGKASLAGQIGGLEPFAVPKLAARQLPRHINRRNCRGTKTLSG